jgi:hypothetical protein
VDKSVNKLKIRGLQRLQAPEQALYPGRTTSGQDFRGAEVGSLRTTHPVDMHDVIHIPGFARIFWSPALCFKIRGFLSLLTKAFI